MLSSRALGTGEFFSLETLLAVALALCFESAKYGFLFSGWGIYKDDKNSGTILKKIGASMVTVAIVIAMLSVVASKSYIDVKTSDKHIAALEVNSKRVSDAQKSSERLKSYDEAISVVDDKIKIGSQRLSALLDEKEQLVTLEYFTKASHLETTISAASKEIDTLLNKKEEYVNKREQEKESIEKELLAAGAAVELVESSASVSKNATVVIAILLEVISLISVITVSVVDSQKVLPVSINVESYIPKKKRGRPKKNAISLDGVNSLSRVFQFKEAKERKPKKGQLSLTLPALPALPELPDNSAKCT